MSEFPKESAFGEREQITAQLREMQTSALLNNQESLPGMPEDKRTDPPAQVSGSKRVALLVNDAREALEDGRPHIATQLLEEAEDELNE